MKKSISIISVLFLVAACQKQIDSRGNLQFGNEKTEVAEQALTTEQPRALKKGTSEIESLIQQFVVWNFSKPFSQWPNFDPDGHLHDAGQVPSSGVYMLSGGNFENPYYTRYVTIDIATYKYVFVPLVAMIGWYDPCDMSLVPKGGQNPEAFYRSLFTSALNGKRDLSLTWDGESILSKNRNEHRANSGVFQAKIDPAFYTGCTAEITNWYSDGYWAKIPLTVGQHTLKFSGSVNWKKFDLEAYNEITYVITVIDSSNP